MSVRAAGVDASGRFALKAPLDGRLAHVGEQVG